MWDKKLFETCIYRTQVNILDMLLFHLGGLSTSSFFFCKLSWLLILAIFSHLCLSGLTTGSCILHNVLALETAIFRHLWLSSLSFFFFFTSLYLSLYCSHVMSTLLLAAMDCVSFCCSISLAI